MVGLALVVFQSQTRSRPGCHFSNCYRETHFMRLFQSQTRSRPGCHACVHNCSTSVNIVSISNEKPPRLPLSFLSTICSLMVLVSISNEKPPRLPRRLLRRDAASGEVSISNEKPPRLPPRVV